MFKLEKGHLGVSRGLCLPSEAFSALSYSHHSGLLHVNTCKQRISPLRIVGWLVLCIA